MSLIKTPPWYFANYTDSLPSTPGTSGAVTSGTSNAEGTPVSLIAAITHDVHYLVVAIAGFNTLGAAAYTLVDILIDRAGGTAWTSFIDNLVAGYTLTHGATTSSGLVYSFPIRIPSGASIGARAQTSHTVAATGNVNIWTYGNPSRAGVWWCGEGVETLGVTSATSRGTSITPGNTQAWGAWTNIGTTTSGRYGAIEFGVNGTDATAATLLYNFEIGRLNQRLPGSPVWHIGMTTAEISTRFNPSPVWCDIPQGTQMQARGACSGTAEVWTGGCAIYGVY